MSHLAPLRLPVRHNQTLDYAGLMSEAVAAVKGSGRTQADIAEALGVTPPVVSRALKTPGGRYASTQQAIIGELTPYAVRDETTPTFRVIRKGTA